MHGSWEKRYNSPSSNKFSHRLRPSILRNYIALDKGFGWQCYSKSSKNWILYMFMILNSDHKLMWLGHTDFSHCNFCLICAYIMVKFHTVFSKLSILWMQAEQKKERFKRVCTLLFYDYFIKLCEIKFSIHVDKLPVLLDKYNPIF